MRLALIPVLLAIVAAPACQTTTSDTMSTTTTAETTARTPEMKALDAFTGKWSGTATLVEATGEMATMMPPITPTSKPTFKGGNTTTWTLGGAFLMIDGWHEMGPGQTMKMTEYMTWDPTAKKYRVWFFSEMGEAGTGWMTRNGNTWESTYETTKPDGTKSTGKGTMTMNGSDKMTWTWTESSSNGSMKMTGTSSKK